MYSQPLSHIRKKVVAGKERHMEELSVLCTDRECGTNKQLHVVDNSIMFSFVSVKVRCPPPDFRCLCIGQWKPQNANV